MGLRISPEKKNKNKTPAVQTCKTLAGCLTFIFLMATMLTFTGCGNSSKVSSNINVEKGPVEREYWPMPEWKMGKPEEHGLDIKLISELTDQVKKDDIYSMLIVKDGYVVSEYYKNGYKKNTKLRFSECAKSITSALVGIALDKGYIKSLDTKLIDFYPDMNRQNPDDRKSQISIKNLLNSTSGIDWPEWGKWNNEITYMVQSSNWVRFVLDRQIEADPGTKFNYNTGAAHILSDILAKTTKKDTLSFAKENLFKPLGIDSVKWLREHGGPYAGGHGIELTARDAARIGYLYLNDGVWNGKRLLSHSWIEESTKKQSEGDGTYGNYGYQWWLKDFKVGDKIYKGYYAMGLSGQYIIVVPEADIVAVFSGWLPGDQSTKPLAYMASHILKAIK